jgi:hypothetical protein
MILSAIPSRRDQHWLIAATKLYFDKAAPAGALYECVTSTFPQGDAEYRPRAQRTDGTEVWR